MAGTFPTLSTGSVCLYPVTRAVSSGVRIFQFTDLTEQRFCCAPILEGWTLTYRSLSAADVATLQSFFDDNKGAFDSTWSFPFLGTTFTNCCFDQDDFSPSLGVNRRYALTLKIRQAQQSETIPSVSAVFPTLNGGVVAQAPFVAGRKFQTLKNDMASGRRYAWANRTTPLHTFSLRYGNITESELDTLLQFYVAMHGPYKPFSFTDPGSVTYTHCRFGDQQIQFSYNDRRQCSAACTIEQYGL